MRLDDVQRSLKEAKAEVASLTRELEQEKKGHEFQHWRGQDAAARYNALKKEADELSTRMKIDESNQKHSLAEKCKQGQVRCADIPPIRRG